ncbi:MAG: AAA family ATPase, partial [Acidobacteriota bacterium]
MEELGGASQLRPYGVLRPLESGPQIRVFLLQSGSSAQPSGRVLTLIPSAFQQQREGLRAVERLYNLRSQTEHPLLPEIRGIGFRGHCAGMVTAFLEHPTLYETVGGWSLEQRLEAAQDILLLLRFLHRRSMHGGWLSPAKIFCRDERVTTVNLVVPSEALAGSCPSPRSLRYCAPEVLDGGTPDPPSDSYSAGMLLYFILTGREPFSDSSEESIRRKQIAVNPTPARILCSGLPEFCQVLIEGMIRKRPRDRFSVDQALHFLSENTSRSRWHVPALSTPMIGRRREYERLQDLIERFARRPRPLVALVSGPAGIGKSFLTEQLEISARTRHLAGLRVAHRETDGAFEAFRHGAFCDPGAPTQGVSGGRVRGAIHSGRRIASWLLEKARQSPLVIRATDLQWLDEGSLEIYRHTLCGKAPILLLGDCRSDEPCPYWKELCGEFQRAGILHELRLGPLSNSELREILHSALGTGWPEAWLDQVTRISAGNPFHLKELLGFLKDSGQLRYGSLGWYGRHLSDSQWEPPLSVSGGLQARIARVTGRKRAILDHLTVLDRPAELDLLARILNRDPHHLLEDLRDLETLGFVEIEGNLACPVLALSHRWLEAVLAQNLPIRSRKRIHRRILRALLALTPAQGGAGPEELARHSIGAQSRQKACKWTRLAVSELKQDRLFRQASVLFERALDEGCLSPVRWTDVRTRIDLLFRAGEYLRCEEAIRAQLAGRCSRSRLPYLWTMLARVLIVQGSLQEAGRLLEQAHSSLEDIPAFRETAAELLACLSRSGELQKARHLAAQLLQAGGTARDGEVDGKVAHALFQFFRASGLQGEAVHWSVRSIRAAARMEDPEILARRCLDLGELHLDWGRGDSAEGLTRYGAETATRVGHWQIQWQALLNRAVMANRAGRISVAERCFREWRRQTHRHPSPDLDACFQIQFALSALYRLQLHQAERSLAGARQMIETSRSDTARRLASVDAQLGLLSGHPDRVIEIARRLAAGRDPLWQATGGILVAEGLLAAGDRRTAGVEARRAGRLLHRVG